MPAHVSYGSHQIWMHRSQMPGFYLVMLFMKKNFIKLFLALFAFSFALAPVSAKIFPDVSENHWAAKQIKELSRAGVIVGYPDGTFKPDKKFLHVSTDEVYGSLEENGGFFYETTPYDPHSPYSASKASSDMLVKSYMDTYKFNSIEYQEFMKEIKHRD